MCLSKDCFETEVKSHSEHWNRLPDKIENRKTPINFLKTIQHFQLRLAMCIYSYLLTFKNINWGGERKERKEHTFISVAQSVAFQCDFGFELFAAQIAEVTSLGVVPVHVGLQIVPAAARVVTQVAGVWLQTCTHGHKTFHRWATMQLIERLLLVVFRIKKKKIVQWKF